MHRLVDTRSGDVISTHVTAAAAQEAHDRYMARLARSLNKPGMQGGVSWCELAIETVGEDQ